MNLSLGYSKAEALGFLLSYLKELKKVSDVADLKLASYFIAMAYFEVLDSIKNDRV